MIDDFFLCAANLKEKKKREHADNFEIYITNLKELF